MSPKYSSTLGPGLQEASDLDMDEDGAMLLMLSK